MDNLKAQKRGSVHTDVGVGVSPTVRANRAGTPLPNVLAAALLPGRKKGPEWMDSCGQWGSSLVIIGKGAAEAESTELLIISQDRKSFFYLHRDQDSLSGEGCGMDRFSVSPTSGLIQNLSAFYEDDDLVALMTLRHPERGEVAVAATLDPGTPTWEPVPLCLKRGGFTYRLGAEVSEYRDPAGRHFLYGIARGSDDLSQPPPRTAFCLFSRSGSNREWKANFFKEERDPGARYRIVDGFGDAKMSILRFAGGGLSVRIGSVNRQGEFHYLPLFTRRDGLVEVSMNCGGTANEGILLPESLYFPKNCPFNVTVRFLARRQQSQYLLAEGFVIRTGLAQEGLLFPWFPLKGAIEKLLYLLSPAGAHSLGPPASWSLDRSQLRIRGDSLANGIWGGRFDSRVQPFSF
ncbi:MAG: hypothetical protein ACE5JX_03960 [Acidobacteriota bacterium]